MALSINGYGLYIITRQTGIMDVIHGPGIVIVLGQTVTCCNPLIPIVIDCYYQRFESLPKSAEWEFTNFSKAAQFCQRVR